MVTKFASEPPLVTRRGRPSRPGTSPHALAQLDGAVRLRIDELLGEQARPIRRVLDELLEAHRMHARFDRL